MDETMRSRPLVSLLCYTGWSIPCAFQPFMLLSLLVEEIVIMADLCF